MTKENHVVETLQRVDKQFDPQNEIHVLKFVRLAERSERYDDMATLMGHLVNIKKQKKQALTVEERNMLSVSYKNVVGAHRTALKKSKKGGTAEADFRAYQSVIGQELQDKCNEILSMLNDKLVDKEMITKWTNFSKEQQEKLASSAMHESHVDVSRELRIAYPEDFKLHSNDGTHKPPNATAERDWGVINAVETQVFYMKMCGDYYRYLAEAAEGPQETAVIAKDAERLYDRAVRLSKIVLEATHPTRLGLALNASVCYYEIIKDTQKACRVAKSAFDEAIQKLDTVGDTNYKDSTLIMQLIRDNLTLWTEDGTGRLVEDQDD